MTCQLSHNALHDALAQYGSPLYFFHSDEFKKNYFDLLNTFRALYPKYHIAYSYKTNYTPEICKLVKEFGGIAEVVSDMEYRLAKKIGYDSKKIIYNGPVKGNGLFEHLREGGTVNVDSLDEMREIADFARENPGVKIRLAFRVNVDIGQGFISRFGLDAYEDQKEKSELDEAFAMAKAFENIKIVGLHLHVGRSRSLTAWENRVRIMFKLGDRYFPEEPPEMMDFGSGMNSVMEPTLAQQFNGKIPSYAEYAAIVANAMREKYGSLPSEKQPTLYTEPGTTLISGYVSFVSTVKSIKQVKGQQYVTFDCSGGNMGDICRLKQLPVTVYHFGKNQIACNDAIFAGYTCLEHDRIYENYTGTIAVGDCVQFRNVGSYSNVFKPPFILPNCAMISVDEAGNSKLIKRAETINDVFQTYVF